MNSWARVASLISVSAGIVGFLYLWGYWRRFGINFLEFATLADLIRLALLPVVGASLFVVALQLVQIQFSTDVYEHARTDDTGRKLMLWISVTLGLLAAGSIAYAIWRGFFRDDPADLLTMSAPIAAMVAGILGERAIRLPSMSVRQTCIVAFLAVCLPLIAYGSGAIRAKAIAEGRVSEFRYSDTPIWSGGKVLVSAGSRYLGTLGNFAFFWTDRRSVLIARWEDLAPLELGREPRKSPE